MPLMPVVVTTNVIHYKQRMFILDIDDDIHGIDYGVLVVFSSGDTKTAFVDCEDPRISFDSDDDAFLFISNEDDYNKLLKLTRKYNRKKKDFDNDLMRFGLQLKNQK
jgi:hypothetical protein